jgi:DNA-binding IclR family transcriptional regulator
LRHSTEVTRSLKRAFAVLRSIGLSYEGVRVHELQKRLGVPRASLYRVLNALLEMEYVSQDAETGLYRLGPGIMDLGWRARASSLMSAIAQPILRDVARATGQLCELVVPLGSSRLMAIDVWHGRDTPMRVRIRAGSATEFRHEYIPGLVLLACGSERALRQYLELAATAAGRRTLRIERAPDDSFFEEIDRVRRHDYAWARQSGREGVGRVGAPVFDNKPDPPRAIAVLGIACASTVLTPLRATEWGLLLSGQARRLGRELARPRSPKEIDRELDLII